MQESSKSGNLKSWSFFGNHKVLRGHFFTKKNEKKTVALFWLSTLWTAKSLTPQKKPTKNVFSIIFLKMHRTRYFFKGIVIGSSPNIVFIETFDDASFYRKMRRNRYDLWRFWTIIEKSSRWATRYFHSLISSNCISRTSFKPDSFRNHNHSLKVTSHLHFFSGLSFSFPVTSKLFHDLFCV